MVLAFSSCANCNHSDDNTDDDVCALPVLYSYVKYGSDALSIFMTDFTNYRHGEFSEYSQHELKCMEGSKFHHIEYMYIPKIKNQTHEYSQLSIRDVTDKSGQDFYFYYGFKNADPQNDPIRGFPNDEEVFVTVYGNGTIFEYAVKDYENTNKGYKKTVISDSEYCYEYKDKIEWLVNLYSKGNPSDYALIQIDSDDLNSLCPDGITDYDNLISFDLYKVVDGELVKAE